MKGNEQASKEIIRNQKEVKQKQKDIKAGFARQGCGAGVRSKLPRSV